MPKEGSQQRLPVLHIAASDDPARPSPFRWMNGGECSTDQNKSIQETRSQKKNFLFVVTIVFVINYNNKLQIEKVAFSRKGEHFFCPNAEKYI